MHGVLHVQIDMMTGPWPGFRALVTLPDGQQQMVQMPHAGAQTFLEDHLAGGTFGGFWRSRRMAEDPVSLHQYGYNQVCAGLLGCADLNVEVLGICVSMYSSYQSELLMTAVLLTE